MSEHLIKRASHGPSYEPGVLEKLFEIRYGVSRVCSTAPPANWRNC